MTSTTLITLRDDQTEFDKAQLAMLRSLGVDENAKREDLAIFFHVAKRTGLDPFARQIYMIERYTKDGKKQTIQTGIDGFRLVAQRTAERTGQPLSYEDTLWCGEDGEWRDVWLSATPPAAAKVTVLRGGNRFPSVALMSEYAQTKRDGTPTQMWATKGALMLAKCAEAGALRKAFPQDLSGIYTADEMSNVGQQHRQQPAEGRVTAADFIAQQPPVDVSDAEVVDDTQEEDK